MEILYEIKLSDNERQIVTESEFKRMHNECIEFDGITPYRVVRKFYANSYSNPGFIDDDILLTAIKKWGIESQCNMVIEECLELAMALQKLKRVKGDKDQKLFNVIDEIADVKIVHRQAEIIFEQIAGKGRIEERVDFKMNRLKERITHE